MSCSSTRKWVRWDTSTMAELCVSPEMVEVWMGDGFLEIQDGLSPLGCWLQMILRTNTVDFSHEQGEYGN